MTQVFFSKVIWFLWSGSTGWIHAAQVKEGLQWTKICNCFSDAFPPT